MGARFWIFIAAVLGGLAVVAGAIGAHALPDGAGLAAPLRIYNTGQLYHALHSLALLAVALVMVQSKDRRAYFAGISLSDRCVRLRARNRLLLGRHLSPGRERLHLKLRDRAFRRNGIPGRVGLVCHRLFRASG